MEETRFVDLYTAEGERLSGTPWEVYPRPQMRRDSFFYLNGEWEFAVTVEDTPPEQYPQTIRCHFRPSPCCRGFIRRVPRSNICFTEKALHARKALRVDACCCIWERWIRSLMCG